MVYKMVEVLNWICGNKDYIVLGFQTVFCTGKNILEWNEKERQGKEKANEWEIYSHLLLLPCRYRKRRLVETKIHFHHFRNVLVTPMIIHFLREEKFLKAVYYQEKMK